MYSKKEQERLDGRQGISEHELQRGVFRKDYARLIHAPSFRRLQNKTQLFPGLESDFFRNRLTHSIEVAQIAGGIAERLNATEPSLLETEDFIDIDLVQFAGAAHDLGHPPFGHNGEHALDDMMKQYGGFEGNAQTLRILTRLEKRAAVLPGTNPHADIFGRLGLNLTFRSLGSILKYDHQIPAVRVSSEELVKGYYASEAEVVRSIKQAIASSWPSSYSFKTVECQIMDVADDIAYSTYDLEDTLKGGFLSPTEMIRAVEADASLVAGIDDKVVKALKADGVPEPESVSAEEITTFLMNIFFEENIALLSGVEKYLEYHTIDRSYMTDGLIRTAFTSWLVGNFMDAVEFEFNREFPSMSVVRLRPDVRRQVEILKHLNYQLVIRSPRLAVVQYRGYDLVTKVFEALTADKGRDLMPMDMRILFDQCPNVHEQRRVICDFIAGMTDRYAVEFYSRLYHGDQSIFKPF